MVCACRKRQEGCPVGTSLVGATTPLDKQHDGDKVSMEFVFTSDANRECAEYLNSPKSVINTNLRFVTGGSTYLTDLYLHNLTYRA